MKMKNKMMDKEECFFSTEDWNKWTPGEQLRKIHLCRARRRFFKSMNMGCFE